MKNLKIKFPNGDTFVVPSEVIAKDRTKYYSSVDGFEENSDEWQEMMESTDEDEIIDWVQNNMDWSDIQPYAVKISELTESYDDMFSEAEFTI